MVNQETRSCARFAASQDVQKRLLFNTRAYEASAKAVKARELGNQRGEKAAIAEATRWLKKLRDEEGR